MKKLIFWYQCNSCEKSFSWVFTGNNDCGKCRFCNSTNIKRIVKTSRRW
ncbi:MAG: hypothetical protein JSU91_02785 [Thermoplasmatales archaeon]|nr:MAG: hypothetical protein JSU91_02785 [Thermoplasmatales archaeon]